MIATHDGAEDSHMSRARSRSNRRRFRTTSHLRCVRAASIVLVAAIASCRSTGPEIPRYEPLPKSTRGEVDVWSDAVWSAARTGDHVALEGLTSAPPVHDMTLDAWWRRLRTLDAEAADERDAERRLLLERLSQVDPESIEHARLLTRLADGRVIDEHGPESERLDRLIADAVDRWRSRARRCEEAGDLDGAIDAWIVVQAMATTPELADVQLQAMDRSSRLTGRKRGAGRKEPLTPSVVVACLEVVLEEHVERLAWSHLVACGFDALDQSAAALIDEADRNSARTTMAKIREETFEPIVQGSDQTTLLRRLPNTTRRAIDQAAHRLADARDTGSLPVDLADPVRVFLEGMLEATDVRTRAFLGRDGETLRRLLGASFVGIGVRFEPHPDGLELHPLPGGPARKAGIRSGDVLIAVDGVPVDGMTSDEIVTIASGRRGTGVELRIRRQDADAPETIVVVRDRIEIEAVHGWRQCDVDGNGRPIWDWIVDPEAAIAFVSIREFDRDTERLFREAMRDADRALGPNRLVQGLILDLRENPGGDRVATERLLDLFINDGDVFRAAGELAIESSTRATIASTRLAGLPVVVLVSGHSASAAELVAGTLQGGADAVVMGGRTFGKGSVQGVHPVANGYLLVTESWFMVPTGAGGAWRPIDRAKSSSWGITPTIGVAMSGAAIQDALAERGEWVSQLGRDIDGRSPASGSLDDTTDRGLLAAAALLRARLLPNLVGDPTKDVLRSAHSPP